MKTCRTCWHYGPTGICVSRLSDRLYVGPNDSCPHHTSLSSPDGLCYNSGNEQVPDSGVPAGQGAGREIPQGRKDPGADRERSLEACCFELDRARKLIAELLGDLEEVVRELNSFREECGADLRLETDPLLDAAIRFLQGLPEK